MSVFPESLESDRLRYERVHPESLDPLELYNHVSEDAPAIGEITEYVSWEPHSHPQETVEFVDDCGRAFDDGEELTCSIRPTDSDDAGEIAGLAKLDVEWDTLSAGLGIWLREPFWGRGYSGERAARFLKLAFSHLDLEVVRTSHLPGNDKSK